MADLETISRTAVIGGNKYRLVVRVVYSIHKVFVLKVLTHAEYDEDRWKSDCGCFEPPLQKQPRPRTTGGR